MKFPIRLSVILTMSFAYMALSYPARATTILVPSQYPTIQQGLNAASSGDTVLVASGTYPENISWPSIDGILLTSVWGKDSTIIDGSSAGRVIDFPRALPAFMTMSFAGMSQRGCQPGFTVAASFAMGWADPR
jgi:hypothetical protein